MEETFRNIGDEMRQLLLEQRMLIDDIGQFKSVKKRIKVHPRPDSLPVYNALYHLGFNNMYIIDGPGASLWNELDSVCVRATKGQYELVRMGSSSCQEPWDPLLDPDPFLTPRDRQTFSDFCDRFDAWVIRVLDVVTTPEGHRYASRFRTKIQKLRDSVRGA